MLMFIFCYKVSPLLFRYFLFCLKQLMCQDIFDIANCDKTKNTGVSHSNIHDIVQGLLFSATGAPQIVRFQFVPSLVKGCAQNHLYV